MDLALTSSSTAAGCGARCPIIKLGNAIGDVAVGGTVAVTADDPATGPDTQAWCRMRGHDYVGQDAADDGIPRYVVRRAR